MQEKLLRGLPIVQDIETQDFLRRSLEQSVRGSVKRNRDLEHKIEQQRTEIPLVFSVLEATGLTGLPTPPGALYFVQNDADLLYYDQVGLAFTTLLGIRSAYLSNDLYLVDASFQIASAADKRYTTISAAIAVAPAGSTIMLAPGNYIENVTILQDDTKIIGSGAALWNSGTSTFGVGTIVTGKIDLNSKKRAMIADLTVNVSGALLDGITSGNVMGGSPLYHEIRNVTIVGSGVGALAHGFVCQAGSHITIRNVKVFQIGHAIALRCSYVNLSDVYVELAALSSVIVKSDTGSGDASHVNIGNVIIKDASGVVVQSAHASYATRHVNISNVTGSATSPSLVSVEQVAGVCQHINVVNCSSASNGHASIAAYHVYSGSDISFVNCRANLAAYVSFRNVAGSRVSLIACGSSNAGTTVALGAFVVGNVNGNNLNGVAMATSGNFSVPNNAFTAVTGFAGVIDLTGQTNTAYAVVTVAGKYKIRGQIIFAANTTGVRGVQFYAITEAVAAAAQVILAMTSGHPTTIYNETILTLAAGSGVQLQAYQNSGGALNALTGTSLEIELLEAS